MRARVCWNKDGHDHVWSAHGDTEEELQTDIKRVLEEHAVVDHWIERYNADGRVER